MPPVGDFRLKHLPAADFTPIQRLGVGPYVRQTLYCPGTVLAEVGILRELQYIHRLGFPVPTEDCQ